MNKTNIGIVFVLIGTVYSLLAWDFFYEHTLGFLVRHDFIKSKELPGDKIPSIGRKAAIILVGSIINIVGLYIIFISNI